MLNLKVELSRVTPLLIIILKNEKLFFKLKLKVFIILVDNYY